MTFYRDTKNAPKIKGAKGNATISVKDAAALIDGWFDWSSPVSEWRAVKVRDMLEHFNHQHDMPTCVSFGIAISRRNGGMKKRSNGENLTWLPPLANA